MVKKLVVSSPVLSIVTYCPLAPRALSSAVPVVKFKVASLLTSRSSSADNPVAALLSPTLATAASIAFPEAPVVTTLSTFPSPSSSTSVVTAVAEAET